MRVGLCVLWMSIGIIFCIFEAAWDSLEDLPLSTLVQRPHKELGPGEPAKPEGSKRTKDVGQLGEGLRQ